MLEGIAFIDVHLMMIDAPYYEAAEEPGKGDHADKKEIPKNPETPEEKAAALERFLSD